MTRLPLSVFGLLAVFSGPATAQHPGYPPPVTYGRPPVYQSPQFTAPPVRYVYDCGPAYGGSSLGQPAMQPNTMTSKGRWTGEFPTADGLGIVRMDANIHISRPLNPPTLDSLPPEMKAMAGGTQQPGPGTPAQPPTMLPTPRPANQGPPSGPPQMPNGPTIPPPPGGTGTYQPSGYSARPAGYSARPAGYNVPKSTGYTYTQSSGYSYPVQVKR